jgi:hypothetical protein
VSDLTDKMRTCAAHIFSLNENAETALVCADAADLLLEAANQLEKAPELPLGEPMEIIPAIPAAWGTWAPGTKPAPPDVEPPVEWYSGGDTLPASPSRRPHKQACPKCESTAIKRVLRHEGKLFVACPVCSAAWPYRA